MKKLAVALALLASMGTVQVYASECEFDKYFAFEEEAEAILFRVLWDAADGDCDVAHAPEHLYCVNVRNTDAYYVQFENRLDAEVESEGVTISQLSDTPGRLPLEGERLVCRDLAYATCNGLLRLQ